MAEVPTSATAPGTTLFWRVFAFNGLVFTVWTVALITTPATVSSPALATEVVVLVAGLVAILLANAVLLRATLAPVGRVVALMSQVDLLRPGQRLPEERGILRGLVTSFNTMLERLEAERGNRTAQVLAAQEAERSRIAQELHDEVGQSLTAVLLGLRRIADAAPPELHEELSLVQEATRAGLDEVRLVVRRLRPGVLDDLGLLSALESLATEVSSLTGVEVTTDLPDDAPALGDDVELVLYRIAQEGLTNVARHAASARARLGLGCTTDGLELTIVDDGVGLRDAPEGSGMTGMRERAILIGASVTFESPAGGGTVVRLRVPLGEDA